MGTKSTQTHAHTANVEGRKISAASSAHHLYLFMHLFLHFVLHDYLTLSQEILKPEKIYVASSKSLCLPSSIDATFNNFDASE